MLDIPRMYLTPEDVNKNKHLALYFLNRNVQQANHEPSKWFISFVEFFEPIEKPSIEYLFPFEELFQDIQKVITEFLVEKDLMALKCTSKTLEQILPKKSSAKIVRCWEICDSLENASYPLLIDKIQLLGNFIPRWNEEYILNLAKEDTMFYSNLSDEWKKAIQVFLKKKKIYHMGTIHVSNATMMFNSPSNQYFNFLRGVALATNNWNIDDIINLCSINPHLYSLDLHVYWNSKPFNDDGAFFEGVLEILKESKQITHLNLSIDRNDDNFQINDLKLKNEKQRELASLLMGKTSVLKELAFVFDCPLDREFIRTLGEGLTVNTTLKALRIVPAEKLFGLEDFHTALAENKTLTSLELDYIENFYEDGIPLAKALASNNTLKVLRLNGSGPIGTVNIINALKNNQTLTTLDLDSSDYNSEDNLFTGPKGGQTLAEMLKGPSRLTELNLSGHHLDDEGTTALAEALRMNTTLKRLNLSLNMIGDKGAKALAEALRINTTLKRLDLSVNEIDVEGATVLAEALKINATLKQLNLSNNEMGDEGTTALTAALRINTTLRELWLSIFILTEATKQILAEVSQVNKHCKILY